jgi:hypothetical protein
MERNAVDVPLTKTAYEEPATRRAWRRTAAFRLSAFLLFSRVLRGLAVCGAPDARMDSLVLFPALLVLIHLAMLNTARVLGIRSLRRVLRVYP